jgi:hypothetical protein
LSDAIDQIRAVDDTLVGERERLLLGESQALLVEDGRLDFDDTVVGLLLRWVDAGQEKPLVRRSCLAYTRDTLTSAAHAANPGATLR